MGNKAACCLRRDELDHGQPAQSEWADRRESWNSLPDVDESWVFFECAETHEELLGHPGRKSSWEEVARSPLKDPILQARRSGSFEPPRRTLELVPEEASLYSDAGRRSACGSPLQASGGGAEVSPGTVAAGGAAGEAQEPHEHLVPYVTTLVREAWAEKLARGNLDERLAEQLKEGFPELGEWTRPSTVRRFLRAGCGDGDTAAQILMRAIECRVRERKMFQSMCCAVTIDMRVIGRDTSLRPTIYICARSQECPLVDMIPQIFLAFEAAVKLSQVDGQVVLIADMYGFSPRLCMYPFVLQELTRSFGSVYADRLYSILVIDFSRMAQTIWSLLSPLLTERTKKKINFVDEARARNLVEERFSGPTGERILSAFDVNRDKSSTAEERASHARRTAICDVPLGCLRPTDEAG